MITTYQWLGAIQPGGKWLGAIQPYLANIPILFKSAVDGGNNAGSSDTLTFAFNNVRGNIMFVAIVGDIPSGNDDISSVTYNGVGMTLLAKLAPAISRFCYLYILENPATGSNNVVITSVSTHYLIAGAVSYSGVALTGQPDNFGSSIDSSANDSYASSLTPVDSNCWVICAAFDYQNSPAGTPPIAGSGSTRRAVDATFGAWGLFDSNAPVTGGSAYSMTTVWLGDSVQQGQQHILASIAPSSISVIHGFFRITDMTGISTGGPFFSNPLG